MDRKKLEKLTVDFTEAFNHDDLGEVMSYFVEDSIYDEFNGQRAAGRDAIRQAFETQFAGEFGKIRFKPEDVFVDPSAGKAMIRWECTLETAERFGVWRGLDLLHFSEDGKLLEKHTYAKAKVPLILEIPA